MSDDDFMCDSDEDYDLEYRFVGVLVSVLSIDPVTVIARMASHICRLLN